LPAKIINGVEVAREIRAECRQRVTVLAVQDAIVPGLAVITVGDNPASAIYVRNKIEACQEVGIRSVPFHYESGVSAGALQGKILELNADPAIHGILVQLPLPAQIESVPILRAIDPNKDVDGFHLYNVGGLVIGDTIFPPCTPYGVLRLLAYERIELEGQNVVVVGASNIVGKRMALMLMQRDAIVCICHAKTRDLAQFTILADVLVVAAVSRISFSPKW
jgi:methylenetetrahydrofolate dehydrogenase (NADP+) / methenyltetrahydrofolate cyclohydrolase